MGDKRKDEAGKAYGKWTVLRYSFTKDGAAYWLCRCKCGAESNISGGNLRASRSFSCKQCNPVDAARKSNTRHGGSVTKDPFRKYLYSIWFGIKTRCYNKRTRAYKWYGAFGIEMFEPWRWNFIMFATWVAITLGPRPSRKHSLDRIDSRKNYAPGNLRWATAKEQANNLKSNRMIYFDGETGTLSHMAEKYGKSSGMVCTRLKHGWTISEALTKPSGFRHKAGFAGDVLFSSHTL